MLQPFLVGHLQGQHINNSVKRKLKIDFKID